MILAVIIIGFGGPLYTQVYAFLSSRSLVNLGPLFADFTVSLLSQESPPFSH